MKKNLMLMLALALGTTACGTQWSGNYSGTWSGTAANQPIANTNFAMTLYQSGSNINGYWLATGAATGVPPVSGQVQGTISGSTLTANISIPAQETTTIPGTGAYTGSLTLNSNSLTGSITGSQSAPSSGTVTAAINLTQSR